MADRLIRVEFYRLVQMWAAVSFFGQLKLSIFLTLSETGLGGVKWQMADHVLMYIT